MAKKILLAEDSATMRKVVELTFASGGYQVTCVDSVERAISSVRREAPDIFIADLSMAGKNGYDACVAIKGIAPVPVLLIHGERARFDAARARQVGADGDLRKPFATQAIIDKVEELLRKKPSSVRSGVKPLSAPIETGEVLLEAEVAEHDEGRAISPSVGAAGRGSSSGAPRPASPAMPPQLGRAARAEQAGLKRSTTMPSTGSPLLPQPPPGMPHLGKGRTAPRAKEIPPPTDIPLPTDIPMPEGAADDDLAVEIMIDAEPPPEVEASAAPPPPPPPQERPRPPSVAAGTIEPRGGKEVPKSPPRRRVPSQPVAPPRTEKAAPELTPGPPPTLERKVAEAAKQAAKTAEEMLPAALRSVDPAVVAAITRLTREVVERVVWEVVPDLAEAIIKDELERLIAAREK